MRPIPAPRLGDAHGLLRAIGRRERLRLDEFVTEFTVEELFPPGLDNALGRTRQFVSFARAAGLLTEDRGTVELTDMGKRYLRAAAAERFFDVAPAQAEWLRRLLRERHMTDSIYHGAAIGLSLYASNSPDFRPSSLDFGRALSYLGRAGWDSENTFRSQGERYTTFLCQLELVDDAAQLTVTGRQLRDELTLPVHMSLKDLAGQLNPGGADAAQAEGAAEWAVRAAERGAAPISAQPSGEEAPAPAPAPAAASAPAPAAAPAPAPAGEHEAGRVPIGDTPRSDLAAVLAAEAGTHASRTPPAPARAARPNGLLPIEAISAAAAAAGLQLAPGLYAAAAAALASGRHLLLVGPSGSGKTTLAVAIAKAAVDTGRAHGATLVTASHRWTGADTAGRVGSDGWQPGHVVGAARRERWLVIDELDRARLDRALGELSSFLAGVPVTLPDGEESAPPGWRIVATAERVPQGSSALLRRFAVVQMPAPDDGWLAAAIDAAAGGDAAAAAAVRRLTPVRALAPVGTAAFLDAARFAAERNALARTDEGTLAREALAAYIEPLLDELDSAGRAQVAALGAGA